MMPTASSVSRGACPGRMPRYPPSPGIWASSTASFTTSFSGVTISSWKVSGMLAVSIQPSAVSQRDIHDGRSLTADGWFLCCRLQFFSGFEYFFNRPFQVKRLFGDVVIFALHNFAEAFYGIGDLHVASRTAGKLFGYVEGLRQGSLNLPGASDGDFLVFAQFVDAENRDDVLQVFVGLQSPLHHLRDVVVFLADDARVENAGG